MVRLGQGEGPLARRSDHPPVRADGEAGARLHLAPPEFRQLRRGRDAGERGGGEDRPRMEHDFTRN